MSPRSKKGLALSEVPDTMHVLFVHQNYPAQFGHIARHLVSHLGWRCTFVTQKSDGGTYPGVERILFTPRGGATATTHYYSRHFENGMANADGVYVALKARPDIRPDLIVGHSGFGSTLFLRDLYPTAPIINLFEFYYRASGGDLDFRPDFPSDEATRLRLRPRNAVFLCDLDNCDLGYCPTQWQRSRLPAEFQSKLRVVFDGIDTTFWKPQPVPDRTVAGRAIPSNTKVVTYASRGMESMRGFDLFMKMAKRLGDRRPDVVFVVVGQDRVVYGGDERTTGSQSFKEWVLAQDNYDMSRFIFTGLLRKSELAQLFCLSDLHIYLTVPFVLSWSLVNALACGATVLASDTAPVREMIEHGRNGLLTDFFDSDTMADVADRVLSVPADYAHLSPAAVATVRERYSLDVCLPQMLAMYEDALRLRPAPA
ncbi:MAG: glycosyltransferase [Gemmataceae bacterium]